MDNKRIFNIVSVVCVLYTIAVFILGLFALWKNENYSGGNHSWLFGTNTEKILMNYDAIIPFIASAPLFIPVIIRRNLLTILLSVCGIIFFFLVKMLLVTLTD
jgi:hypothetical protein